MVIQGSIDLGQHRNNDCFATFVDSAWLAIFTATVSIAIIWKG